MGYFLFKHPGWTLTAIPTVNGEDASSQIHHEVLILSTYVIIIIISAIGMWWIIKQTLKLCRLKKTARASENIPAQRYEVNINQPEDMEKLRVLINSANNANHEENSRLENNPIQNSE